MPMAMVPRTLSQARGFMKALIGAADCILGFTALGAGASEAMAVLQMAMMAGLPHKALATRTSLIRLPPTYDSACS
jgi:pyruvate/2-oxoglutarate dehydrogenase complex dihydrolipoamide dehydrogenase (E3) component